MHRWMMWALMGAVVMTVVAGCEPGDGKKDEFQVTCVNGLTTGQTVDVHIVPGAEGSSPNIANHTPDVRGLVLGGDAGNATVDGKGDFVVIFVVAGTDQVLGRGYFTATNGGEYTATLEGDGSVPPTVEIQ